MSVKRGLSIHRALVLSAQSNRPPNASMTVWCFLAMLLFLPAKPGKLLRPQFVVTRQIADNFTERSRGPLGTAGKTPQAAGTIIRVPP